MTTAPAPPRRYTPEDLIDREDGNYELLDGCLVEREVSSFSTATATRTATALNVFLDRDPVGETFDAEMLIAIFPDPNRVRKAHVSFVRYERLPDGEFGILRVPPDLIVEVMSPSNSGSEMRDKVDEWLGAGVHEVWVMYPNAREVYIYRSDAKPRVVTATDDLESEVLPGFNVRADSLFPRPRPAPAATEATA